MVWPLCTGFPYLWVYISATAELQKVILRHITGRYIASKRNVYFLTASLDQKTWKCVAWKKKCRSRLGLVRVSSSKTFKCANTAYKYWNSNMNGLTPHIFFLFCLHLHIFPSFIPLISPYRCPSLCPSYHSAQIHPTVILFQGSPILELTIASLQVCKELELVLEPMPESTLSRSTLRLSVTDGQ